MATVRHRRLARELREYRENAGLKMEAVADQLGWDRSKISRLETFRVKPKVADVEELLGLYGVTSPEHDALIKLARDIRHRGWWTAFGDVFDGTYVGLEDEAYTIRSWRSQLVPGLLQTEDYARAVITAARPDSAEEIHKRVRARMARRPLLSRPGDPPLFRAVLDEAVLRRQIGGPEVMRAQLSELWAASRRPNITIQVLPFSAGAHAGVDGSWVILGFEDDRDPDVVYIESPAGDVYPESTEQITRLTLAWQHLTEAAMSTEDSALFIADLTRE
jgi:transcriptional regulator with XRE-family HTH domain